MSSESDGNYSEMKMDDDDQLKKVKDKEKHGGD